MRILVWQWGRFGAGPRFAACLADALRDRPGIEVSLSLSRGAEILAACDAPHCEMKVTTYRGWGTFFLRLLGAPLALPVLVVRLARRRPDLAICAMPGPLDLLMAVALRLLRCRVVVVVHDADAHAGDGFPLQMTLQRLLCRTAHGLAVLSSHVGQRLRNQGLAGAKLIPFRHPPFPYALPHTSRMPGPPRLLCFGRLLPYKGLDVLAAALRTCHRELEVRVVGRGPETPALAALRACPNVQVENAWVPEDQVGALLAWADAVVLPYREASQSGVGAAALAAGRPIIATRVGGLKEQLADAPQVVLCDPDPDSLSRAIGLWLDAMPSSLPAPDARAAWRSAASDLLQGLHRIMPRAGTGGMPPSLVVEPDRPRWTRPASQPRA